LPIDVTDGLVPTKLYGEGTDAAGKKQPQLPEVPYLWVGAHLTGEGFSSPVLRQIRVAYDQSTYREYLPALFSLESKQTELLDRLLSLMGSFYSDVEVKIADLQTLFLPQSVPVNWLDWLAGWLAVELDENWPVSKKRQAIIRAIASYRWRGTLKGLKDSLLFYAGVDAQIDEPITRADWWALADDGDDKQPYTDGARLGANTRLAPVEAGGAVLNTTAILDRSNLIGSDEFGVPLFTDVAHQFTVSVHRGQVRCEEDVNRIREVIEREKPAHTVYELCVIEPSMRVGFQARLGIDTVVGKTRTTHDAGGTDRTAGVMRLGGQPHGRMGADSSVGQTTRMTDGSVN
jgi:phage tail-like protein